MCVASAFPIATGKHIGDCNPVPPISASCTPALEAGDATCKEHGKHKDIKESGWESGWEYCTLSVPFVLFVHKK